MMKRIFMLKYLIIVEFMKLFIMQLVFFMELNRLKIDLVFVESLEMRVEWVGVMVELNVF